MVVAEVANDATPTGQIGTIQTINTHCKPSETSSHIK